MTKKRPSLEISSYKDGILLIQFGLKCKPLRSIGIKVETLPILIFDTAATQRIPAPQLLAGK